MRIEESRWYWIVRTYIMLWPIQREWSRALRRHRRVLRDIDRERRRTDKVLRRYLDYRP